MKPDYVDAIVYKGLLLRLQANLEKDPAKQQQLLKDATAFSEKANGHAQGEDRRDRALRHVNVGQFDPTTDWIREGRQSNLTAFFLSFLHRRHNPSR